MSLSPAKFSVRAVMNAQSVPRLINFFAQLDMVPSAIVARKRRGGLEVRIEQSNLSDDLANVIAGKMRSCVLVEHVVVSRAGEILSSFQEVNP